MVTRLGRNRCPRGVAVPVPPGTSAAGDYRSCCGLITNYITGYLYAYPEHCSEVCKPEWQAFLAPQNVGAPAVANGVVYVDEGNSAKNVGIDAFSVHCATGGGTCAPLWHGDGGSYYVPSGPVVAGGELWATGGPVSGPANLYAFGLPVPGAGRATDAARGSGRPAPRPVLGDALAPAGGVARR